MIAVAENISDPDWLKAQTAEGLALITSTLHDKTVHLLSSMQANAEAARLLEEQHIDPMTNHLLPTHPDYVDPDTLQGAYDQQDAASADASSA
jgi:hypothetical protein